MTEGRNDDTPASAISVNPAVGGSAPPPNAPDAKPGGGRRLARAGIWVLAGLVVALLIVGSLPYWAPSFAALLPWHLAQDEERPAPPRAAVAQRLTPAPQPAAAPVLIPPAPAATAAPPAVPPSPAATEALARRVAALEQQAATPSDRAAALAPIDQSLARLSARLDAIEVRLDGLARSQAARRGESDRMLLLVLAELRGAAATSRPFVGELAAVEALAQGQPQLRDALAPLQADAATGIPSTALLAVRFSRETAPTILRATAASASDESWGSWVLARLRGLVVIRRVDATAGATDPLVAAVQRAAAALDAGDLAGAVAAVHGLSGAPAEAAAPWLGDATRRLAVETALATATARVADHLAAATSPRSDDSGAATPPAGDETR